MLTLNLATEQPQEEGEKARRQAAGWHEDGCGATSLVASSNLFHSLRPEPVSFMKKAQEAAESGTMGALVAEFWFSKIDVLRSRNNSPCRTVVLSPW